MSFIFTDGERDCDSETFQVGECTKVAFTACFFDTEELKIFAMKNLGVSLVTIAAVLILLVENAPAAPPDITNSTYVIFDYWTGVFGADAAGGWGKTDGISIEQSEVSFDGSANFTRSSSDFIIERKTDELEVDYSGDDNDFRYELNFSISTNNPTENDSGTTNVSEYGRVALSNGETAYTGVLADTLVRFQQDSDVQTENLSLGFGVRQPTGVVLGDITSTFIVYTFQHQFSGGPNAPDSFGQTMSIAVDRSEFSFDGVGGVSESFVTAGFQRAFSEVVTDHSSGGDEDTRSTTTFDTDALVTDSGTDSGSYSVSTTGLVTLNVGSDVFQAQLGADGQTAAIGLTDFDGSSQYYGLTLFGFGVKQGSGMSNSDISGTYSMVDWEHIVGGSTPNAWGETDHMDLSRSTITVRNDGTFLLRDDTWSINRVITNQTADYSGGSVDDDTVSRSLFITTTQSIGPRLISGTYTLSTTGAATFTYSLEGNAQTISGQFSADGKTFVYGETEFDNTRREASASFGIAIRRLPPASSVFSLGFCPVPLDVSGLHLCVTADSGTEVQVIAAEDLASWEVINTQTATGFAVDVTDSDALNLDRRFYRLILAPW